MREPRRAREEGARVGAERVEVEVVDDVEEEVEGVLLAVVSKRGGGGLASLVGW